MLFALAEQIFIRRISTRAAFFLSFLPKKSLLGNLTFPKNWQNDFAGKVLTFRCFSDYFIFKPSVIVWQKKNLNSATSKFKASSPPWTTSK